MSTTTTTTTTMILANSAKSLDTKTFISFWLFGIINNALYVVILSAASDLVGPSVPKALVLLFDVLPSFMVKITAPFYLKFVPYNVRILLCVALSFFGMVILSSASGPGGGSDPSSGSSGAGLAYKMFGITLASLSTGLGEVTFLSLTHFYKTISLNAWSSGTGFAGIFGSFNFMVMTTWLKISTKTTLFWFSVLPFAFLAVFWHLLPVLPNINDRYLSLQLSAPSLSAGTAHSAAEERTGLVSETIADIAGDSEIRSLESGYYNSTRTDKLKQHVIATARKIWPLVVPYMVPLSVVYFAEYLINQGISPTLLFPLDETPFSQFRDIYVTYATLYQIGVFISRSSASFVRIRKLYIPAELQTLNLVICLIQALYMVIPNVYIMFLLIFYEGLLGGASYVNTFMSITEEVPLEEREFALGTVSISDSLGVGMASLFGMWAETSLCKYQVDHGRDWCRLK